MLTLPIYDLPTRSASGFLIRHVLPRSVPPQLLGPTARKQPFQILTMGDTIIGVGHGNAEEFAGHNDEVILDINSIPMVNGKVVFLISCETAQALGPELIRAGAAGFIGWREDLVWIVDADLEHTPWRDKLAATVMIPIVKCVNELLDGRTAEEAFTTLTDSFAENARIEEDELIRSSIIFDKNNAVLLGDTGARVRATPRIILPVPPPPILLPLFLPRFKW